MHGHYSATHLKYFTIFLESDPLTFKRYRSLHAAACFYHSCIRIHVGRVFNEDRDTRNSIIASCELTCLHILRFLVKYKDKSLAPLYTFTRISGLLLVIVWCKKIFLHSSFSKHSFHIDSDRCTITWANGSVQKFYRLSTRQTRKFWPIGPSHYLFALRCSFFVLAQLQFYLNWPRYHYGTLDLLTALFILHRCHCDGNI